MKGAFHRTLLAAALIAVLFSTDPLRGSAKADESAWDKLKEGGKHALVVVNIKARYADRKDIPGLYIRVRFDGRTLQLAGFVQNREVAKAAEDVAQSVAKADTVQTFWEFDEAIASREPYKTHIGEQTEDGILWTAVRASLAGPDVRPQFKNADLQQVSVNHGNVTVYIVADAPPAEFDLAPHVKPVPGVTGFQCRVVKTY